MELEDNVNPASALDASIEAPNEENHKQDVTDIPPRSSKISNLDICFLVISIIAHCSDVCIDVNLVVQYYLNEKLQMFAWTITLIMVPSFINTIVSLQMYRQDEEENEQGKERTKSKSFAKGVGKVIVVFFIVMFQFTMAQRCFLSLKYALKSRACKKKDDKVGQRKYFIKMLKEEQDIALLRVLESWAMVSYHRSIRLAQVDKKNIDFVGSVLQFLWHLFITTSRIACVSAAAIFSTLCVILACFFHWIGMTLWIIMESRGLINFCQKPNRAPHLPLTLSERIKSTLFSCVLGFVYIFIYLNPEDTNTYTRHLFYYTICLLENISASILILLSLPSDVSIVWYHYLISATCIIPFIIGIIIMIFYYLKFHPSMKLHTFNFSRLLKIR
ncbi:hypothetical protein TSAR_011464 [Trichomalopsis sarcophagae]|uniref:XK-related protein n=1 Tax=Trichomalopsis sarcophagae TaxID=543379 RepID=A0A232FDP8_9HYME|nr:hypothetical protein TSAR_011464 [Trichomalopsis sarcophagae]